MQLNPPTFEIQCAKLFIDDNPILPREDFPIHADNMSIENANPESQLDLDKTPTSSPHKQRPSTDNSLQISSNSVSSLAPPWPFPSKESWILDNPDFEKFVSRAAGMSRDDAENRLQRLGKPAEYTVPDTKHEPK